jgi:hypothetical protein
MGEGLVLDGTIAQDSTQTAGIWGLREGISVALKHAGAPSVTQNRHGISSTFKPQSTICMLRRGHMSGTDNAGGPSSASSCSEAQEWGPVQVQ